MSSGFTDDLFPADETIRYYNRTKAQYPNADMALFFGDFGHQRGQNKADVTTALRDRENAWFDHYIKGAGPSPQQGAEAFTQTCPKTAPSGGPYSAESWAQIAPGEVRFDSSTPQTIAPDSTTNGAFNPVTSSSPCATTPADDSPGAAVYELDLAPAGGYTLLGAVSVIADFTLPGGTSQVAARVLDVAPDGTETLVDRGLWRPATGGPTKQVFQLHPNGWTFAEGHIPKLELLASDATAVGGLTSYGRRSNNQQPVDVANLELRMPVVERPGADDGLVVAPAKKFVPDGYELAPDFAALRTPRARLAGKRLGVRGKKVVAKISCPAAFESCNDGKVLARGSLKPYRGRGGKGGNGGKQRGRVGKSRVAVGSFDRIAGGKNARVKLRLTKPAKRVLSRASGKRRIRLRVGVQVRSGEVEGASRSRARVIGKKGKRHSKRR